MELPYDVLNIIKEFSNPITRPDWRLGCYYNRQSYFILGGYMSFDHIIYTLFKITYFNYEHYNDMLIFNHLMGADNLIINQNA